MLPSLRALSSRWHNVPLQVRKNSKLQTSRCRRFDSARAKIQNCRLPMLHISFTSTKTPILCSNSPKTGAPKAKSAQKPRFCARNARKQGLQTPKAHKNPDFVLEKPENGGPEGQKSTKTPILCSGRRGLASGNSEMASGIVKVAFLQITAHASKTQMLHNQIINF